jgi:HK97 family phage prohead protease
MLLKAENNNEFTILKSDGLVIGGYASIEMVDKQNDLITLSALDKAVKQYMGEQKYRNVMSNHSNVQVGEVIEKYRDKNGNLHKTAVDDVGFYVVIKMRDDIEKAKEISRGIRKGTLRSFSIGGQAISKKQRTSDEHGEYNEIDRLELHEVTICEKGINPEAKFDILKRDVGGENKMSEKLEKALEELNDLMKQVGQIHKEDEEESDMENMSYKGDDEMESEDEMEDMEMKEDDEMDEEKKGLPGGDDAPTEAEGNEAGEEVVTNGNPKSTPKALSVSKGLEDSDFTTLNLTHDNVEKAYEAFKAEQLERMAYDNLSKTFADRFQEELSVRKSTAERAEYDARVDVAGLKAEFAELRKSLTEKDDDIRKATEVAFGIPEGYPTTVEEAAEMSWDDIHNLTRGN